MSTVDPGSVAGIGQGFNRRRAWAPPGLVKENRDAGDAQRDQGGSVQNPIRHFWLPHT
jgi:hypothetical protein